MAAEGTNRSGASTIRAFRAQDAAAVHGIAKEADGAANWPEASYRELLDWRSNLAFVSEVDGQIIGFIIGRQLADEAEILNLAVTQENRRKGEGSALLQAALEEFRTREVSRVFLEVRESNHAAISFYERHGFAKTGRRASYYHEPDEAAILMEKMPTG
jgi:ribosomal-protein-alanine acetyltransferase